jgi:hypothetical protein
MGLHRDNTRSHPAAPRTHGMRFGGRVTLFNYNPSIAGGAISVKRYHNAHRLGKMMRQHAEKAMVPMIGAEGAGMKAHKADHIGGMMGLPPSSSTHHKRERQKRVREAIEKQFSGSGTKRRRAAGGLYA